MFETVVDFFQDYVVGLGLPDALQAVLLPVAAIADIFATAVYGLALALAPLLGVPY
jgi:hypothetical protein